MHITGKGTAAAYSQNQYGVGLGYWWSSGFETHLHLTQVSSDNTTYNGISVVDLGAQQYLFDGFSLLTFDFYHSQYPSSTLGTLSVNQASVAWDQYLFGSGTTALWFQLGLEGVAPSASIKTEPTTGFTVKDSYARTSGELSLRTGGDIYSIGYWTGSEAFGVRNGRSDCLHGTRRAHIGSFGSRHARLRDVMVGSNHIRSRGLQN